MRIILTSVLVDDQEKALRFYTDVLGFVKKTEIPLGEHRWLTVVSPDDPGRRRARCSSPTSTPPRGRSRTRWSPTASRSPRSPSTTSSAEFERLARARRALHPGAGRDGAGHDRGARRHLRQPDPDRRDRTA